MNRVKVKATSVAFSDLEYRTPLKFGTGVVDTVTDAVIMVEVETPQGHRATGKGEILLGDLWAFRSTHLDHLARDAAMRVLTFRASRWLEQTGEEDHPLGIGMALKEAGIRIAADITREFYLGEPIPPLAALVCVSPLDAAVHDAFGKAYGIDTYDGYAPEMCCDLSRWLGEDFRGRYLNDFISPEYRSPIPIWHLVGGLDKLRRGEKRDDDPDDELPVSLDEWIARDGVFCFKVKLRGNDPDWDLDRTKEVFEVAKKSLLKKGIDALYLSVDMNEQCESPEYCVEFLEKLRGDPNAGRDAFDSLLFLEQPVERNLRNRAFDMQPVARIKPVLADEGIVHLEDVDVAFKLGWSGVALKTCKGHTGTLLTAAKTAAAGKIYTVQDLTNPGLALIHSVGMAARLSPLKGVEANARQFIPQANDTIGDPAFQAGLVNIRDGYARWPKQGAVGLGY